MSEKARKPMGRPRMSPDGVKLHAIGLRTDLATYELVNGWARSSGKSVAQELEKAIEFRQWFEDMFKRMFGGPLGKPNTAMLATFEHAGNAAARHLPDSEPGGWLSDPYCYRTALAETVMAMLEQGPDGFSEESFKKLREVIDRRLFSKRHSGFIAPDPDAPQARVYFDEDDNVIRAEAVDKDGNVIGPLEVRGPQQPKAPAKRRA